MNMDFINNENVSYDQHEELYTDNRCRLCGIDDARNVKLFLSPSVEKFLTQIVTVYPIIVTNCKD